MKPFILEKFSANNEMNCVLLYSKYMQHIRNSQSQNPPSVVFCFVQNQPNPNQNQKLTNFILLLYNFIHLNITFWY